MGLKLRMIYMVLFAFVSVSVISCDKEEEPEEKEIVDNSCDEIKVDGVFTSIPNLDFDDWSLSKSKRYNEPIPTCFWATGNPATDISILGNRAPVTVFKVGNDSARTGYAAMLQTSKFRVFSNQDVTAGGLASGNFKVNITDPGESLAFGKPFTQKIKKVSGYYKYFPGASEKGVDSLGIYALMMMDQETLAIDKFISSDTAAEWTLFELNLRGDYAETPNKVSISFGSSEGGPKLRGEPGSTLFIDDVSVEYY